MHSPGVSRRGIGKSCQRTIPRPSSPATGSAHRAAILTESELARCCAPHKDRHAPCAAAAPSGSARFCDGTNWTLLKTRNMPIIDSKTLVTRRFCKYGRSTSAEEKHGMLG